MKNNKLLVVVNDAGGAHQIASYLKFQNKKFDAILMGPAKNIFKEYDLKFKNCNQKKLKILVNSYDLIITGSGWQTNLEKKAIFFSNFFKKKSITILDHWSNYKERFLLNKKKNLPSEIWTNNLLSKKLLIEDKFFKKTKIKIIKNYFKKYIIKNSIRNKILKNNILFCCEPFIKSVDGFSTTDLIKSFIKFISKKKININLNIRFHPSQNLKNVKFDTKLKDNLNIKISNNSLINDLSNTNIVVGCNSYSLIVALWINKKTYFFFPNENMRTKLPSKKILNFRKKFLM